MQNHGQQDGSAGEGGCCQAEGSRASSGTRTLEAEMTPQIQTNRHIINNKIIQFFN